MMSQQTIANFRDCTGKKDYLKQLINTKQNNQLNSGLTQLNSGRKMDQNRPLLN